jgi:hypothetical protein
VRGVPFASCVRQMQRTPRRALRSCWPHSRRLLVLRAIAQRRGAAAAPCRGWRLAGGELEAGEKERCAAAPAGAGASAPPPPSPQRERERGTAAWSMSSTCARISGFASIRAPSRCRPPPRRRRPRLLRGPPRERGFRVRAPPGQRAHLEAAEELEAPLDFVRHGCLAPHCARHGGPARLRRRRHRTWI